MRALLFKILGVACIVLGGLTLSGKVTAPSATRTIDLGVVRATAQTRQRLPDWVGFAALGAGILLLLGGGRSRD